MIFGDISMSEEQTRRKEIEEIVKAAIEKQEDRKALAYAFYKFIKIGMCHASNKSLTNQEVEKYLEHYEKEMLYEFDYSQLNILRDFRNRVIHGELDPTEQDLSRFNQLLESILKKLRQNFNLNL